MQPTHKPITVKRGCVTVKIYRTQSALGYQSFQVADYSNGTRKLRAFADLAQAKKEAGLIADRMSQGDLDVLSLRSEDRAAYLRAVEALRGTDTPLEVAAVHYAEACKILRGDSVIEAARFYAKRHPAKLPRKLVPEVVQELIETKRGSGVSELYLSDLRYRLGKFEAAFHCPISSITANQVQQFLNARKLSARSYINFLRVIGTLFRFAKRRGYLPRDHDEIDHLEKVKDPGGEIEIFTVEEMSRLLGAASKEYLPALAIGGFTGLRSAEIQRLEWPEVNLAEGFIEVTKGKSKTASRRLVPITDNLAAWIGAYAEARGKVWPYGHDDFYRAQRETAEATASGTLPAVKWKANALRHSFISYRLATVQNVNQVALEAGNSPQMIFKHYRELVRPSDATKWFAIVPASPPGQVNDRPMPAAAAA